MSLILLNLSYLDADETKTYLGGNQFFQSQNVF